MAKKKPEAIDNVYVEKPVTISVCCKSCGSAYSLSYMEDDVTGNPVKCPFCGDYSEEEELDLDTKTSWEDEWEDRPQKIDFDELVEDVESE